MRQDRRKFVQLLGMGVVAGLFGNPVVAWADRIRILGGGDEPIHPLPSRGQISPEFKKFVTNVSVGEARGHRGLRVFWLYGGLPVIPLAVATLEEARSQGNLFISERDQATVPGLIVENRGKSHVLLLGGEILLGGKQNRVLMEDVLFPPMSGPRHIGVYCVEQGRWSGRRQDFESKESFAAPGLRSQVMEKADQGRIWVEVDRYARMAGAPSATQSYQEIYEKPEVKEHLEDLGKELGDRAAPGALGAAVFTAGTLAGLDLFFDPGLFAREWPKLLRAQALDAYRQAGRPYPDERELRRRVEALLQVASKVEGTLRANAGVGTLFEYRLDRHRGSALVFDGRIVHAAIL
jgi:hypothetical protein